MAIQLPVRSNSIDLEQYGLRPIFPDVLDSSMVKDFMYCPSYFYLRHVLGLRKKVYAIQEDAGRDWGTKWHEVKERYHEAIDLSYEETRAQVYALEAINQWPASINAKTDKHGRSQERMIQIFFDYTEKFGASDRRDFEPIRAEQFFDIFDEEFEIRWCGRVDRIVRRKSTGRILPWDYKTTSYLTKYYFEQFEFSFQFPGYVRMISNIVTEPVYEIFIDVLYTLKKSHEFFRRTIRYTPGQIEEWGRNVRNALDWMYWLRDHHLYNPEAWIKNWNHCTKWNKACAFADVHWNDPSPGTRLRILQNDYVEERWDPSRADLLLDNGDE